MSTALATPVASHPATQAGAATEHIVILGGGFAGWYAARHLAGVLPLHQRITLIDRNGHMLYTPMLTEVAGGTIEGDDIAVPPSGLPKRVRFLHAEVASVDVATKRVTLGSGEVLEATQLVIALGSTTAYHSIAGAEENSLPLKTLKNATEIGERLDALVAEAAKKDGGMLSLVVAGGGYTGVEAMAALNVRMRERAEEHGVAEGRLRTVLVEPSKRLMQEMPESLAGYAQRQLEADGVEVRLGVEVTSAKQGSVELSDGSRLDADLLLWDAGIEPSPLLKTMDVPLGKHHGVVVDAMMRVKDRPGVWALGDCAEIPKPGSEGTYAPTAQNATREGVQLARNVNHVVRGRQPKPFRYEMLGQLALVSEKDAIANVLHVQIRGLLAWGMWWAIYIMKLPSFVRQARVLRTITGKTVRQLN